MYVYIYIYVYICIRGGADPAAARQGLGLRALSVRGVY